MEVKITNPKISSGNVNAQASGFGGGNVNQYIGRFTFDGGQSYYDCPAKITFNTNNLIISKAKKLVFSFWLRASGSYTYNTYNLRAVLSTTNFSTADAFMNGSNSGLYKNRDKTGELICDIKPSTDPDGENIITKAITKPESGQRVYFVFDLKDVADKIKPDQTYYIYLCRTGDGFSLTYGNSDASAPPKIEFYYESFTNVTAPSSFYFNENGAMVSSTKTHKGGKVQLNWSGAKKGENNEIDGYKIFYTYSFESSNASVGVKTKEISTEASANSITIDLSTFDPEIKRGSSITFSIKTIGTGITESGERFDSEETGALPCYISNQPQISLVQTLDRVGSQSDSDNKSTLYIDLTLKSNETSAESKKKNTYKITYWLTDNNNNGEEGRYVVSVPSSYVDAANRPFPLAIKTYRDRMKLHCILHNGFEEAEERTALLALNEAPKLESLPTYKVENTINSKDESKEYARFMNVDQIEFTKLTSKIVGARFMFTTDMETAFSEEDWEAVTMKQANNVYNLELKAKEPIGTGGAKIYCKMELQDSTGDIWDVCDLIEPIQSYWETDYHKLYNLIPTGTKLELTPQLFNNSEALPKYLSKNFQATLSMTMDKNDIKRTAELFLLHEGKTSLIGNIGELDPTINSTINKIFQEVGLPAHGYGFQICAKISDETGRVSTLEESVYGGYEDENNNWKILEYYERLPLFSYGKEGIATFGAINWKPLVAPEVYIKISSYDPHTSDPETYGRNFFKLKINYENKKFPEIKGEKIIDQVFYNGLKGPDMICSNNDAISQIDFNITNKKLFKLIGLPSNNNYNVSYEIIAYNAAEEECDSFLIQGYEITTIHAPEVDDSLGVVSINNGVSNELTKTIFNPDEEIYFGFKKPTDLNETEWNSPSLAHKIIKYRVEWSDSYEPKSTWQTFAETATPITQGENENDVQIKLIAPNLHKMTQSQIYFRLVVQDEQENWSEPYDYYKNNKKPPSLYAARKEELDMTIKNVVLNSDNEFEFLFVSKDLGGDGKGASNFYRNKTESHNLTIWYSDDGIAFSEVAISGNNRSVLSKPNSELAKEMSGYLLKGAGLEGKEKIYFKIDFKINTNALESPDYIIRTTPIYVFYNMVPTMSHRKHWVGINTSEKEESEIFKIKSYGDSNIIRLCGTSSNNKDVIISINVDDGTLICGGYSLDLNSGILSYGDRFLNLSDGSFAFDSIESGEKGVIKCQTINYDTITGGRIEGGSW